MVPAGIDPRQRKGGAMMQRHWMMLAGLAALAVAAPALADVRAGVEAWSRGDYAAAVAEWEGPAAAGDADAMLRNVAEQMLQSLPEDMATAGRQPRQFTLEGKIPAPGGKFDALGFQVWEHGTHRRLLSSRAAPAHSMVPSFKDGFGETSISGAPWRVYAISDSGGRVQVQTGIPRAAMHAEVMRWLGASLGTALLLLLGMGIAIWLVIHCCGLP